MKPMLAATARIEDLDYPLLASPKLDGVRGIVDEEGVLRSRSLKTFPNPHVQSLFSRIELAGLDGELIVGPPTAKDVYRVTSGACQRHEGKPDVRFYAFDFWIDGHVPLELRLEAMQEVVNKWGGSHVVALPQRLVRWDEELLAYEEQMLADGYEGLILRNPHRGYKWGRSTVGEAGMLKLKRFEDAEAEVIGVEEEMHNANEAKKNALGRTERSSHKANLVGTGRMGALRVRDLGTKVEFSIGTGFTAEDRLAVWPVGTIVKYKHFAVGAKDLPRFPVFLGRRMREDA